jgi:hypothetical protein
MPLDLRLWFIVSALGELRPGRPEKGSGPQSISSRFVGLPGPVGRVQRGIYPDDPQALPFTPGHHPGPVGACPDKLPGHGQVTHDLTARSGIQDFQDE